MWRKALRRRANLGAARQVLRTIPPDDPSESLSLLMTFVPSDGIDSALSRLMITATNGAMDCFARATTLNSTLAQS
jgi:hypothetical protein